jgi:hypothetical protein
MLELVIARDAEHPTDDDEVLWLQVANVGGGARAAYAGELLPSRAASATLTHYPRWSEPAGALCTRMLHATLKREPAAGRAETLSAFVIQVRLVPHGRGPARVLARYNVSSEAGGWYVHGTGGTWHVPAGRGRGAGAAALHVLKHVYWSGKPMRRPRPITPRIYRHGKVPYIRMWELPEPARSAFLDNMARSGRPCVPSAPDAAYLWDWTDFLAGAR